MDLVLVERGELTRGDVARGELTVAVESSRNDETEMLCLRFLGDDVGSFFGLDGPGRLLITDGDRGDDMEGDWSRLLIMSPEDDRVSFSRGCSISVAVWDSQGRAAIHRSNQLQPHCGLLGSMNVGFPDFDGFLHSCCLYKKTYIYGPTNTMLTSETR